MPRARGEARPATLPAVLPAASWWLVVASALAAVAIGLWPVADRPATLASLLVVFGGTLAAARRRHPAVVPLVFAGAYVSHGVVRLLAGPAAAAMPYWLAAFAGLSIGGAAPGRWRAAPPWQVPLAWWGVTVALLWPLSAWRAGGGLHWPPAPATGPVVTAALLQISLALWMDRLLSPDAASGSPARNWRPALLWSAVASAGAALCQAFVDPSWLSREPWISLGRSAGLMGDANPFGVAAALWTPLALWTALTATGIRSVGHAAAATLLAVGAWTSGARTTVVLAAAGCAGLAWALGAPGLLRARAWVVGGVLAAMLGAIVLGVGGDRQSSPLARLRQTVPQASLSATVHEVLWRRDGYGLAAVAAIREHPLAGVGIGRFSALAPAYHRQVAGREIPPDNGQNLWRHTLAEEGLLGLFPLLWLSALTIRSLVAGRPTGEDRLLRAMVAGLGLALLVGYPVQDAAIAATVATLVAAVAHPRPAGAAAA